MPTTSRGFRYPASTDLLAQTHQHIKNLADDVNNSTKAGSTTGTTDANGDLVINHGMTGTPLVVDAMVTGSSARACFVWSITSTTFTVRVRDVAAGGAAVANTNMNIRWRAAIS